VAAFKASKHCIDRVNVFGRECSSVEEKRRRRKQREKEKLWENDPELYGIRRSNRPRYEPRPPKLERQESSSGGHKRKSSNSKSHSPSQGKVKRRKVSSEDDDSSDEEHTRYFLNFLGIYLCPVE